MASDTIVTAFRSVRRRAPRQLRSKARAWWAWAVNIMPDAPFLLLRRGYDGRFDRAAQVQPPALLRMTAFRKRIPGDVRDFELLGRPGMRMLNADSIMTRVIFWVGDRCALQCSAGLDLWAALSARATRVVEIGANVGYYSIAGGSASMGEYLAYEPHPRSCATLRTNLRLNDLDRVEVVEAAVVSDALAARADLICPTGPDSGTPAGAMVRGSSLENTGGPVATEAFEVTAVSFAEAICGSDLVKLDVEGLEASLLKSARTELARSMPAVMIEIHDQNVELRRLLPDLTAQLDAAVFAMHSDHLVSIDRALLSTGPLCATYGTWDYLIVPAPRSAMTGGLVVED